MQKYDVIIAGAGPAGVFLAYKLKKNNIKALILEKEIFPRYKICAGGLSKKAYDILCAEDIDIEKIIEKPTNKILYVRDDKFTIRKSETPLIYMTYRSRLDSYLLKKAVDNKNIQFKDKVTIIKIDCQKKIVKYKIDEIEYEVNYDVFVGAWGNNPKYNKLINLYPYKRFSISSSWEGPVGEKFKKYFDDSSLCQILSDYPKCIGYIFPKLNKVSAGIFTSIFPAPLNIKNMWDNFAKYWKLDSKIKPNYALIPIRDFDKPIAKGNTILVGDAAGLADPFTGEGIYYAFVTSNIAAKHIVNFLKNKNYDLADLYNKNINSELYLIYKWAKIYESFFHTFPTISFWLGSECYIGNKIVNKFVTGEIKYNEILKIILNVFKIIFRNKKNLFNY